MLTVALGMNTKTALSELTSPVGAQFFQDKYWQRECLGLHSPIERFGPAIVRLAAQSVPDLLLAQSGRPQAWFNDKLGGYRAISLRGAAEAMAVHSAGMTLYFDCADAVVGQWKDALVGELGRKPGTGIASFFASGAGDTVRAHIDCNENFTIQLRGRKRWFIEREARVQSPQSNWVTGRRVPHWLRRAAPQGLPTSMSSGADVVDLVAGSMLYVPAGIFHATETVEDSLSLNISMTGEGTWSDLIQELLADLLSGVPEARAYATGAWTSERSEQAHRELDGVLELLRTRLSAVRARDMWGVPRDLMPRVMTLEPTTHLRKNPLGGLFFAASHAETKSVIVYIDGAEGVLALELSSDMVAIVLWLETLAEPFGMSEVLARARSAAPDDVGNLLRSLLTFGYLQPSGG
jgi:hypothetical protein